VNNKYRKGNPTALQIMAELVKPRRSEGDYSGEEDTSKGTFPIY